MVNLIEIGKSGIKVPFLGMGTWAIGGGSWWGDNDDELSVKTIQRAIDLGIKWIDTAPIYGLYHSEDVVGKAIKGKREQIILSTKCALEWRHETSVFHKEVDGTKVYRDLSKKSIIEDLDHSLLTLGTDYIDVLYTHWQTTDKKLYPIEETMDTTFPNGDVRNNNPSFQPETRKKILDILKNWKKYLEKYECSYSNLVIALTSQMMDGLHILGGARKPEQIEDNTKTLGVCLEEADIVQMKKDIETLL